MNPTLEEAAKLLAAEFLTPKSWLVSVGIGGLGESEKIHLHTITGRLPKVATELLKGYMGHPVEIVQTGRFKPLCTDVQNTIH